MKRKIYLCPKCGKALNFSDNPEYTFQCLDCDEDFYSFEAKEMEQPRMEGVKNYTQLAEASMQIKAIAEKAIQESHKQIEIKGKDIVEQICEYIYETIKPVLDTGINECSRFRDSAAIYTSHFKLTFASYGVKGKNYQVQLWGHNGTLRVYFNINDGYYIEETGSETMLRWLVEEWAKLKDSMHRMIPYAISRCNEENQKKLEQQKEMSEVIDSFRL